MSKILACVVVSSLVLVSCSMPPLPRASTPVPPTGNASNNLPAATTPARTAVSAARTRRAIPTRAPNTPQLPPGFQLTVIHNDLSLPSSLASDGKQFYVSEFRTGRVLALRDGDGDDILDTRTVFGDGFQAPRGLAVHPTTGDLYVSARGSVQALRDVDGDGRADQKKLIVDGLADFDVSHSNNGIAFDPSGEKLYLTDGAPRLGDLSKQGEIYFYENKPLSKYAGTILVTDADGADLQIFARGFRNPFDLTFDNRGNLYATDNGEDTLPGAVQGDELNLIVRDGDYGYPTVSGPPPPASPSIAPLINFPAHASPNGIVFYTGNAYPEPFRNQLYIALYQEGRKIVRAFQNPATGQWEYVDFITDLDRPIDLIQGADGRLYFLDMNTGNRRNTLEPNQKGILYRVDYAPP